MNFDVVTWLLAVLDEEERIAKEATPGPWKVNSEEYAEYIVAVDDYSVQPVAGGRWGGEASVFESTADAIFIARHDPAAVLADIAAKRVILGAKKDSEWCGLQIEFPGWDGPTCSDNCGPDVWWAIVKLMAAGYSHLPGYLEEWKP